MGDVQIYALQCPGCGAKLSVAKSLDVFGCSYCGATIKLAQAGGTVALELLTGHLEGVKRGTDKTAAELALRRLNENVRTLRRDREDLSALLTAKREEFLVRQSRLDKTQAQLVIFATVVALFCAIAVANASLKTSVTTALVFLAIGGFCFVSYRGIGRQKRSIDLKERNLLADSADRDAKLATQIETITRRIAETQKIADA